MVATATGRGCAKDVVALIRQDDQPLDQAARELIVMDLYRRGIISGGKATELLGMDRLAFIQRAADLGIPYFQMTKEDLEVESTELRHHRLSKRRAVVVRLHCIGTSASGDAGRGVRIDQHS